MKVSSAGMPIYFTVSELKVLWALADDKGHSEREIAENMVRKDRYQPVYSKSLSDVDNVSKVITELEKGRIIFYEFRNLPSEKAKRGYPLKILSYHTDML